MQCKFYFYFLPVVNGTLNSCVNIRVKRRNGRVIQRELHVDKCWNISEEGNQPVLVYLSRKNAILAYVKTIYHLHGQQATRVNKILHIWHAFPLCVNNMSVFFFCFTFLRICRYIVFRKT